MKEKNNDKQTEAKEPVVAYTKVRIFHSFEEANEADALEMSTLSPEDHLRHATQLIMNHCGDELRNKPQNLTIYFK